MAEVKEGVAKPVVVKVAMRMVEEREEAGT